MLARMHTNTFIIVLSETIEYNRNNTLTKIFTKININSDGWLMSFKYVINYAE